LQIEAKMALALSALPLSLSLGAPMAGPASRAAVSMQAYGAVAPTAGAPPAARNSSRN